MMNNIIYLAAFDDGDVHRLTDPPSLAALHHDDVTYIRITIPVNEELILRVELDFYSTISKEWVSITP